MAILDLIKKRFMWIILGTIFFYILLILVSDVEKISESFLKIKIEFLVLIFALGFLSHIVRGFRQYNLLHTLDEKIPLLQNMYIYMSGLSFIITPGGAGTFIKSLYLKERLQIPVEKSIAVILLERYHDLLAGTTIILASLAVYFSLISASLVVISSVILGALYLLIRSQRIFVSLYSKISKIRFISKNIPDIGPNKSLSALTSPKNMTKGWMFSIMGWSIDALAVYVVFLACKWLSTLPCLAIQQTSESDPTLHQRCCSSLP